MLVAALLLAALVGSASADHLISDRVLAGCNSPAAGEKKYGGRCPKSWEGLDRCSLLLPLERPAARAAVLGKLRAGATLTEEAGVKQRWCNKIVW